MRMKLIFTTAAALIATVAMGAATPQVIQATVTGASTNATAIGANDVVTNTEQRADGYVHALELDFSGYATATVDVDVVSLPTGLTLFSIDNVTADKWYFPREIVDTTAGVEIANTPEKMPLINDRIILSVYAANTGAVINVNAKLYYDSEP